MIPLQGALFGDEDWVLRTLVVQIVLSLEVVPHGAGFFIRFRQSAPRPPERCVLEHHRRKLTEQSRYISLGDIQAGNRQRIALSCPRSLVRRDCPFVAGISYPLPGLRSAIPIGISENVTGFAEFRLNSALRFAELRCSKCLWNRGQDLMGLRMRSEPYSGVTHPPDFLP